MFPKTVTQVNDLIIASLTLLILATLHSQATANPECPKSWQPAGLHTISDDLLYEKLADTLDKNIQALQKTAGNQIQVCGQRVDTLSLINGYSDLQAYISRHSPQDISTYIQDNFDFCPPRRVLITGYYEPIVPASLTKTGFFPVPLYTTPKGKNLPKEFRATRATIETTNSLKGHELVYVADAFTAFTIHIQGSALLTFNDGSKRQLHYHRNNDRPYTSIGRVLIEQGVIKPADMSMQAIKTYTQNNPRETPALLQTNKRFIYFTLSAPVTDPVAPSGSFNVPLTPHRSIALDPKLYPQGLLFYLQGTLPVPIPATNANRPQFNRREFGRFMLNQDSGKAIKGHHRLDLFMGRGQRAEMMAGEMQEDGCLTVLLPK